MVNYSRQISDYIFSAEVVDEMSIGDRSVDIIGRVQSIGVLQRYYGMLQFKFVIANRTGQSIQCIVRNRDNFDVEANDVENVRRIIRLNQLLWLDMATATAIEEHDENLGNAHFQLCVERQCQVQELTDANQS